MKLQLKKIAAVTMVRGDWFYLRKWVEYYGGELGPENLYIYFDGSDQTIPDFCAGTNAFIHEKIAGKVVEAEKGRLGFLSDCAASLLSRGYDLVIGADADEYIVADPACGMSLPEFLSSLKIRTSVSPLGLDVGQNLHEEKEDIDPSRPFLSQRHYAEMGPKYTKPSIVAKPCRWGAGFHRIKGHNFHIVPGLYMFHCGYFDSKMVSERIADKERAARGETAHFIKRAATIKYVTEKRARNFERWTAFARSVQSIFRPPYAPNKPTMLQMKIVVRIPERFSSIF